MCEQCEALSICGVPCHETGCPDSHLHPFTGAMMPVECKDCGCEFIPDEPHQAFCDDSCVANYYGMPADDDPMDAAMDVACEDYGM